TKIKMGSKLDLVISSGIGSEAIPVPDLVGMTYEEARALLDAQGIILGAAVANPDVKDTTNAFVYKQRPTPRTLDGKRLSLRSGQMVDLFLQKDKPVIDTTNKLQQPTTPQQQPNNY